MPADRHFRRRRLRDDYDFAALLSDAHGLHGARGRIGGGAARNWSDFRDAVRRIPALEIRWTEADCNWILRSGRREFMAGAHDARRRAVVDVLGCGGERIFYRFRVRAARDAGDGRAT